MLTGFELAQWPLGCVLVRGQKKMDWSHVQNVANAEILAAIKCLQDGDAVGGRAYHVTDGHVEKHNFQFIGRICAGAGAPYLPLLVLTDPVCWLLCKLVSIVESLCFHFSRLLRPHGPPLKPFTTRTQINKARYHLTMSIDRARRDLGFVPAEVEPLIDEASQYLREQYGDDVRSQHRRSLLSAVLL